MRADRSEAATGGQEQGESQAALSAVANGPTLAELCDVVSGSRTLDSITTEHPQLARGSGTSLRFMGPNPTARALDMILRWIADGLLARSH